MHQHVAAVALQFADHVDDLAVAQVRAVLLEGEAQHDDVGALDVVAALDHLLDGLLGDVLAHAVVDATAGQDDLRVVAQHVGLVGEVVGSTPMQWPPTRPGRKGRKFHLVPAALSTSRVSMPILWKITESSFIRAMLRSRWVFR
jgi:hypothetical protein